MRGSDDRSGSLFSYVVLETRVRRDRPLRAIREIANAALVAQSEDVAEPYPPRLASSDRFPVDGTLIEAWASIKSFRRKDGNDDAQGPDRNAKRDFPKEKRSSETHAGTTDPYARLHKKGDGQPARLCVTGRIRQSGSGSNTIDFSWDGNDEMDEVDGDGWAKLQPDRSLQGQSASTTAMKRTPPLVEDTSSLAC